MNEKIKKTDLKIGDPSYSGAFSGDGADLEEIKDIAIENTIEIKQSLNFFSTLAEDNIRELKSEIGKLEQKIKALEDAVKNQYSPHLKNLLVEQRSLKKRYRNYYLNNKKKLKRLYKIFQKEKNKHENIFIRVNNLSRNKKTTTKQELLNYKKWQSINYIG